jgi:hypothetical protein
LPLFLHGKPCSLEKQRGLGKKLVKSLAVNVQAYDRVQKEKNRNRARQNLIHKVRSLKIEVYFCLFYFLCTLLMKLEVFESNMRVFIMLFTPFLYYTLLLNSHHHFILTHKLTLPPPPPMIEQHDERAIKRARGAKSVCVRPS